jgi:hypothetical protein
MRRAFFTTLTAMAGLAGTLYGEAVEFRLGGVGGQPWAAWTGLNVMVDYTTVSGSIQPLELKPDENLVPRLGPWYRWKFPPETQYRPGNPRIWRGINYLRPRAEPRDYIDGDINTFTVARDFGPAGHEFYTIDVGTQVPLERFVFYPPEGNDPFLQEPYRPNFAFEEFEFSASNDEKRIKEEEPAAYRPLDVLLASVNLNIEAVVEIRFPLEYLRFLRIRFFPDNPLFSRYALAEMEVYGRGFVPRARWQSQVIDLEQIVNIGQVRFGESTWRREDEQIVAAPGAPVGVKVEIRTGLDDTPIAYHSYNDLAQPVEVSEAQFERLKSRVWPWDPPAVGWRGPIADDTDRWSFWSPPLRESGQRPRVPKGRYLQVQVELETQTLWEFARLDSLVIETSPLLAERVLGEVAVIGDLHPPGNVAQVEAGTPVEFVYDLRAEFAGSEQSGFDAVRVLLPSPGTVRGLEMGEPLATVEPDSVVPPLGGQELVVYLPERIHPAGLRRLRLRLETAVFGASGELGAEVFAREAAALPQGVEGGDVGEEIGTNQLRVLAVSSSLGSVLGDVAVHPASFTPQGDGVNEEVEINYTLFRLLDQTGVEVNVFTLGGQRVRRLSSALQGAGRYQVRWGGEDDGGRLVAPGIYLVRIGVDTDDGLVERVHAVAVVY